MKNTVLLVSLLAAVCLPGLAQDQPRWEFFGGYSFGRLDTHDTQNALNLSTSSAGLPRNPVKRRLVESPEQSPWGSDRFHLFDEAGLTQG